MGQKSWEQTWRSECSKYRGNNNRRSTLLPDKIRRGCLGTGFLRPDVNSIEYTSCVRLALRLCNRCEYAHGSRQDSRGRRMTDGTGHAVSGGEPRCVASSTTRNTATPEGEAPSLQRDGRHHDDLDIISAEWYVYSIYLFS